MEITYAVAKAVKVPISIKLTPQVADVVEMVKAVKAAGASAVTIINRFVGFALDIERRASPPSTVGPGSGVLG